MKVVILAGGKGTRLGLNIPKVMVPVDGIPLLQRTIASAVSSGFSDITLMTGHLSDHISDHFGSGAGFGAKINYVREEEPLGTAGCFNQIRDQLAEPFIVVYGDILLDVDFQAFARFALEQGGAGTLFVHPNDHPFDSDLVEMDFESRIIAFHSKPHPPGSAYPNLVNAALYVLFPEALDFVPDQGASDWGRDILPRLARERQLFGYRSCEYAKDIGTSDRLERAEAHLRNGKVERLSLRHKKPALFLDRDGVINVERGGVHKAAEVQLIAGTGQAVRAFNDAGVPVICVTNQPDLAKGLITWDDLRGVIGAIDQQLAQAGAYIDDLYICPHHPERGWSGEVEELKIRCDCRKPAPGMLREAAAFHNLDLRRSWLVGDRYCDVAAAKSAGVRSVLVATGHAGNDRALYAAEPDLRLPSLAEAAPLILEMVV